MTTILVACATQQRAYSIELGNMADGMEDLKLTVNTDFAKKLHKQKEKAELDQCKFLIAFLRRHKYLNYDASVFL